MKVLDVMRPDCLFIRPDQTIRETSELLRSNRFEGAPVVDDQYGLLGVINKDTILQGLERGATFETAVADIMMTRARTVSCDDELNEMFFDTLHYRPVVKENKVIGILLPGDLERFKVLKIKADKDEIEAGLDATIYNPVIQVDQDGRITIFNRAASRVLGIEQEKARNRSAYEILGDTPIFDFLMQESEGTVFANKLTINNRSFLPYRTMVRMNGQPAGAVLVMREISEMEELIRESEYYKKLNKELDAIIESSFDGIYITDGKANTLRINKGFERIMGVTSEQCVGRNMAELVRDGVFSQSGTLLALERQSTASIQVVSTAGKTALVTSTPIFDEDNNIILVVTNVRDITELNDLQAKLEHMLSLRQLYETELQQLKLVESRKMIFTSNKMNELVRMVLRIADVDSTVLIQGESGVGKELIAEIIHSNSNRKDGPFIKVNCGAIPENLLESELFGYEAGAFTGASKSGKVGLFELANGGILFLDEIGELPLNLQVKLLRVLQDRQINRVGGRKPIKIDIRILAGTNRNLQEMVTNNQFRLDLYYRLNVIPVVVPPLRERKDDIPSLTYFYLDVFNNKYHMNKRIHSNVMDAFQAYNWPGNVRELENLLERLVVTGMSEIITTSDLPAAFEVKTPLMAVEGQELQPLREAVESTERKLLEKAFSCCKSTYQIARALGINQSTVVRKAAKYGLGKNLE